MITCFNKIISGVMSEVAKLVMQHCLEQKITNIPYEVVLCLVRTRTFIRINNLNKLMMDKIIQTKRNKVRKFIS